MKSYGYSSLQQLLAGSKLLFPTKEAPNGRQSSADYALRRDQLLLREEERNYARMTANVSGGRAREEIAVPDVQAAFKFQAGMGLNMILAVGSAFGICYWASKFFVKKPSQVASQPAWF
ncbi:unnamed protein product [Chrysoparadoxa australica]